MAIAMAASGFSAAAPTAVAAPSACAAGLSSVALDQFFDGNAAGFAGGDYAHAYPLGGDRTLWIFQDSFTGNAPTLWDNHFTHNAALLQTGTCFTSLTGASSYLGGSSEQPLTRWFWPTGGALGSDGNLHVFAAEMRNDNGTGAADGATPVATWVATIRPSDAAVLSFEPAPDAGERPLYGFAVANSASWTYLYGNCYRQFTTPSILGSFDTSCTTSVFVGRVPRGRFDLAPTYWNGDGWSTSRADAVPVHQAGVFADPLQVRALPDGRFLGVSKLDDWFGTSISMYVSSTPSGPFVRYATVPVAPECVDLCNTYFATPLPWTDADGAIEVAISSHTWDSAASNVDPALYRPTVLAVPPPAPAIRSTYSIEGDRMLALDVAGRLGVAEDATAVTLTLTATEASAAGYVTVWPCEQPRPLASNVNLTRNGTTANLVVSAIGAGGTVCLWSPVDTELIVDVQGWEGGDGAVHPLQPARLLDTRPLPTADGRFTGIGAMNPAYLLELPVAGRGGVDPTARFVAVNITTTESSAAGYVTVWPCGAQPATSNVNLVPKQDVANLVIVELSPSGSLCLRSSQRTQVVVDVQAWYPAATLRSAGPARVYDTRSTGSTIDGSGLPRQRLAVGGVAHVSLAGRAGIGSSRAVVVNLTVTEAQGSGYVVAWPCDQPQPTASNLNFTAGLTRAALTVTAQAGDGSICVAVGGGGSVNLIVDAFGWLPTDLDGYEAVSPVRMLDTRG